MDIEHEVNDALMRFFDHCARFVKDVDTNPSAVVEVDKFKSGPEMSRVLEKMANKLNVTHNNLTYGHSFKSPDLLFYWIGTEVVSNKVNLAKVLCLS